MKSHPLILVLSLLAAGTLPAQPAIIADHRAVDGFADIPASYLAQVRNMLLYVAGESHSTSYGYGPELLAAQNSQYAAVSAMMGEHPIRR